jgi:hypothetical protein
MQLTLLRRNMQEARQHLSGLKKLAGGLAFGLLRWTALW